LKILVTGADGQLGRELLHQGVTSRFELIPAARPELDIADAGGVAAAIGRLRPFAVINAAAYTKVDNAEDEPHRAFRVNAEGAANLARSCRSIGVVLIQLSTDYVFDGRRNAPYKEGDPVAPTGVYARSKAAGEELIRSILPEHIILRTSWLYGVFGYNFVKTMLRLGREAKVVRVVNDQYGSPTSAVDLSQAILKIVSDIRDRSGTPWGTYHYCGKGITSWHAFAEEIFRIAAPYRLFEPPLVEAIPTSQYPTRAKRPRFSALDCNLIHQVFNIAVRPWTKSLTVVMKRILDADAH
jgi:dTDP-4-dehydrorhamnose reductase